MGSDGFSVPCLEACLANADVAGVFTQPDRRSGRGRNRVVASPVKELAAARGLRIEQPERFDKPSCDRLAAMRPDLTVVAAYGRILPGAALRAARIESINVHASLLPRHRGASPVAAAILAGDAETGVTVMRLRPRLDAGEIVCYGPDAQRAQRATAIGPDETAGELMNRLAKLGGEVLADVLAAYADGSVTYEVQDDARATYAPLLCKEDGRIGWSRPAEQVVRQVRAMTPWPGAFTDLSVGGTAPLRVIVLEARTADEPGRPGVLRAAGSKPMVGAGGRSVELVRVKPAGRTAMAGAEFLRGLRGAGQDGEEWVASS